jgi:acetyltransferase-like isoleucine patch superfamily enzyme
MNLQRTLKYLSSGILSFFMRGVAPLFLGLQRIYTHAQLSATLNTPLPISTVVFGRIFVYGSRQVDFGENVLLYPGVHLETQEKARICIGDDVVMSSGVHVVAMAGVTIGNGTIIGEYTSIRDANHNRDLGCTIRNSGHISKSINIGREVWLGRGVTILGGVTIGDRATVGANAVVTKDVSEGATVVGIPAAAINLGNFPVSRVDKRSSFRY